MNPDTNRLERLHEAAAGDDGTELNRKQRRALAAQQRHAKEPRLLRPDGSEVPEHWSVFQVGERVVVKNYTFKVGYIGEGTLLLEPAGPILVGDVQEP